MSSEFDQFPSELGASPAWESKAEAHARKGICVQSIVPRLSSGVPKAQAPHCPAHKIIQPSPTSLSGTKKIFCSPNLIFSA